MKNLNKTDNLNDKQSKRDIFISIDYINLSNKIRT